MDPKIVGNTLKDLKVNSYVIYDFRGSNHVGRGILNYHSPTTRRWIAVYTDEGKLHLILPRLEVGLFSRIKAEKHEYSTFKELGEILKQIVSSDKTVALDYSPENGLSILDVIPAGFMELLKKINPKATFITSGDITQALSSRWGNKGLVSNKKAGQILIDAVQKAIPFIQENLSKNKKITDLDVENFILDEYKKHGLITQDNLCIVSTNQRASSPHYWPTKDKHFEIKPNSVLLFDVWGKLKLPDSIYADCTFMAWIGPKPIPQKVQKVWEVVRDARNLGVDFVKQNIDKNLKGYQIDEVVRNFIAKKGFDKYFIHRTGHSIDVNDHGSGANLDSFESKDERSILPDTGFSIEPGIYLKEFGVRSEIDVYIHPDKTVEVTTFLQKDLLLV